MSFRLKDGVTIRTDQCSVSHSHDYNYTLYSLRGTVIIELLMCNNCMDKWGDRYSPEEGWLDSPSDEWFKLGEVL